MATALYLDSTPLGLLTQWPISPAGGALTAAIARRTAAGDQVVVPSIVEYELRREILRLGKRRSLEVLARFMNEIPDRRLLLTQPALDLAASFWAEARRSGKPTADPHALDIDLILAAQVRLHDVATTNKLVVTANPAHLEPWVDTRTIEQV